MEVMGWKDTIQADTQAPEQQPSTTENVIQGAKDLGQGVAQGATLGFADELYGAGSATKDEIKDILQGKKGEEWMKRYRAAQQEAEKAYEEAEKRSPVLTKTGEVAGTIGAGVLTAGEGLAVGGTRLGLREAAKEGAIPVLKSLAETGITAAGLGGAQAAGMSKANTDTEEGRQQLAEEAKGGAKTGAILGIGLSGAGALGAESAERAGGKLKELVQESPVLRQILKSRKEGLEGKAINESESAVNRMAQEQLGAQRSITGRIVGAEGELGNRINAAIKDATDKGINVEASPQLQETLQRVEQALPGYVKDIGRPDAEYLMNKFQKLRSGEMMPTEAKELREKLMDMMRNSDKDQIRQAAFNLQKQVNESLTESVPGLKDLNAQFSGLRRAGSETILSKGEPSEYSDVWMGDLKKPQAKLSQGVTGLLQDYAVPGTSKIPARRTMAELSTNLEKFEEKHPGLLDKLGLNKDKLTGDIKEEADKFAINRQALGYEPKSSPLSSLWALLGGGATTGRGQLISKANLAGRAERAVGGPIVNMGKNLYAMGEDSLKQVAQTLKEAPGVGHLGDSLLKGLEDKNTAAKNAAIFAILQNPQARAAFTKTYPEEK